MQKQTRNRAAKAQTQKAEASPRQIKVQFTIDPESVTAKRFALAVSHYGAGSHLGKEFQNVIAKLIVQDWLSNAVSFPMLLLCGRVETLSERRAAHSQEIAKAK